MNLLAIDTATESCSVALSVDGTYYHKSTVQPRGHAELVLPFIDEILSDANIQKTSIDGLIVGQGPGAFTGVRIGVAVAQGISLALNLKVIAVSNLTTLAFKIFKENNITDGKIILVATDARMNEVYWAKYRVKNKQLHAITQEQVGKACEINLSEVDFYVGSGFAAYPELMDFMKKKPMDYNVNIYSQALDMLKMSENNFRQNASSINDIEPVYLREP